MTDKQYITLDDLPQIAAALKSIERRDLPGAGQRPLSSRQAVIGLAEILLEKKRAGFTTEDLLEALKAHNLSLTAGALNRYLKEYQEAQPKTQGLPVHKKPGRTSKIRAGASEEMLSPPTTAIPTDADCEPSAPAENQPAVAEMVPQASTLEIFPDEYSCLNEAV